MSNIRTWLAEKSPEEIELFLGEVPRLWLESGQFQKFCSLLTDYDFIEAKINHTNFGVQLLIEDYNLIDDLIFLRYKHYDIKIVNSLKLIRGALQLSTHILNKDTKQLSVQLSGRLLNCDAPKIQELLEQILQSNSICLRSLIPSLTPPGSILVRTLSGHCSSINSVAITYDNKYVISASDDTTLIVWDFHSGRELLKLSGHTASVNAVVITPDNKYILSGSSDKTIKIWDFTTGKLVVTLTGHNDSVNTVIVTSDGRQLISAASDNVIKVWNLEKLNEEYSFTANGDSVNAVTVTPNNEYIIFHSNYLENLDCRTKISHDYLNSYNLNTGKFKKILINMCLNQSFSQSIAITPDKLKAISGSSNKIVIRNIETGEEFFQLIGHSDVVKTIAVTSNGNYVISGASDKMIRVWNLKTKKHVTLRGHSEIVNAVTLTSDNKYLVSASNDKTVKIWNLESEENISITDTSQIAFKPKQTSFFHAKAVISIGISLDGRQVVSISEDENIKVWSLKKYYLTQDYFLPKEKFVFPWNQRNKSETANIIITTDCKWAVSRVRKHAIKAFNIQTKKTLFFRTSLGYMYDFLRFLVYFFLLINLLRFPFIIYLIIENIILDLFNFNFSSLGLLVILIIDCIVNMLIIIFVLIIINELENKKFNFSKLTTCLTKKNKYYLIDETKSKILKFWNIRKPKKMFITQDYDNLVNFINPKINIENTNILDNELLNSLVIAPGVKHAISISRDNNLKIWDSQSWREICSFTGDSKITCCAIAPDGTTIVAGDESGRIHFLRLQGVEIQP